MKIETPILRRLGPVPFWRGSAKCLDELESVYRRARAAAAAQIGYAPAKDKDEGSKSNFSHDHFQHTENSGKMKRTSIASAANAIWHVALIVAVLHAGCGLTADDTVRAAWFVKDISCKVGTPLAGYGPNDISVAKLDDLPGGVKASECQRSADK